MRHFLSLKNRVAFPNNKQLSVKPERTMTTSPSRSSAVVAASIWMAGIAFGSIGTYIKNFSSHSTVPKPVSAWHDIQDLNDTSTFSRDTSTVNHLQSFSAAPHGKQTHI
jgi:hypothetical protein